MLNVLFISAPLLTLVITSGIKISNAEFEMRGFGLDAHIIGIMYIYPLPLLFPANSELILTILLGVALTFTFNAICFVKSKGKKTVKKIWFERIGLSLGVSIFLAGLIAALLC
ncbi:MAG: hypothetical protein NTW30_04720 [Candidatus Aenigmarchaeota archaeon]|nr:hypothetical protein [Candidatus Aenigmarchaeota archaeon]